MKINSVGMPRIMKRPGTFGFSSTFIFANRGATIVFRRDARRLSAPGAGMGRTIPPRSRRGVTPFLISSSKLLSVNVFTFSDAIVSSPKADLEGHASLHSRAPVPAPTARSYTLTY